MMLNTFFVEYCAFVAQLLFGDFIFAHMWEWVRDEFWVGWCDKVVSKEIDNW